jgi:hypothetical protein
MLRRRLVGLVAAIVAASALAGPASAAPARPVTTGPVKPTWLPADLSTRRAAEVATALVVAFVAAGLLLIWIRRRRFTRRLPHAIDMADPYRYRGL